MITFTGDRKVVEVLVRNNADVNLENKDKETPLIIATIIGDHRQKFREIKKKYVKNFIRFRSRRDCGIIDKQQC